DPGVGVIGQAGAATGWIDGGDWTTAGVIFVAGGLVCSRSDCNDPSGQVALNFGQTAVGSYQFNGASTGIVGDQFLGYLSVLYPDGAAVFVMVDGGLFEGIADGVNAFCTGP